MASSCPTEAPSYVQARFYQNRSHRHDSHSCRYRYIHESRRHIGSHTSRASRRNQHAHTARSTGFHSQGDGFLYGPTPLHICLPDDAETSHFFPELQPALPDPPLALPGVVTPPPTIVPSPMPPMFPGFISLASIWRMRPGAYAPACVDEAASKNQTHGKLLPSFAENRECA